MQNSNDLGLNPQTKRSIVLEIDIPVKSEGNIHGHWIWAWHRKQTHRAAIITGFMNLSQKPTLPCDVTFVRLSPRSLDSEENLPYAFKAMKDCVAQLLVTGTNIKVKNEKSKSGRAVGAPDSDKRIVWHYKQEKSKTKGYRIIFDF